MQSPATRLIQGPVAMTVNNDPGPCGLSSRALMGPGHWGLGGEQAMGAQITSVSGPVLLPPSAARLARLSSMQMPLHSRAHLHPSYTFAML